ncbi:MAG TPA: hypothetical protein VFG63_00295, partial [Nocardioidaceae bacterium]|nr:hypothetical protein [Nocardioidaceae bacterium]
ETLRIEGRTWLSTESDVLEKTALDGRLPWAAIVMDVTKVFTHCGKAYKRSRLWDPASWPAAEDRPRMGAVMAAHIAAPVPGAGDTAGSGGKDGSTPDVAAVEADLAETYRERLWSPEST